MADERAVGHLDIGGFVDLLHEGRWLIAVMVLVAMLAGIGYAVFAQPVYQSDILIQVEDNPSSANNVLASVQQMFDTKPAASDEIDILGSRLVVSSAVEEQRLYISAQPRYFPVVGRWIAAHAHGLSQPGLFGWGGFVWGTERARVSTFDLPQTLYGKPFQLIAEAAGHYRLVGDFAGVDAHGTVGVPLTVTSSDGPLRVLVDQLSGNPGATFLLTRVSVVTAVQALQKALRITQKNKDSNIINASLQGTDPVQTSAVLTEIGEQYVQQNAERKSEEAQKSIAFLGEQLPKLKRQLEDSESAFNAFRARNSTIDLSEEGTAVLQQAVDAQNRLVELEQKRNELLARFTGNHPAVLAVTDQITLIKQHLADIEAKTKRLPELEQTQLRLQRDVQVNTDLYTSLLNTAQQLHLVRAGKVGNARLVDSAVVPDNPVKPNRKLVVALALAIGLFGGITVAWVRRQMFGGIGQPQEIESAVGLPVFASVPLSKDQQNVDKRAGAVRGVSLLAHLERDSLAIESLRSFRTALQIALLDAHNNVVLMTGAEPNVGKSFVSANLAAVLAASNQRVLLIDADMRRGDLNRHFNIAASPGLAELIGGTMPPGEVVHRNVLPKLDVLTRGGSPPNPSELLLDPSLGNFLRAASAEYDVVIVDSPPVLAVADAATLGHHAGTAFLVVRQGATTIARLREATKRLSQVGVLLKGVVFNGVRPRPGGYGYGYARQYRYQSTNAPVRAKERKS